MKRYHNVMRYAVLSLAAMAIVRAQAPHYVEFKVPHNVDSAKIFIRYVLDSGFGGWVDPKAGVSSYFLETAQNGKAARRLRALIYAPGCAIETYDLAIAGSGVEQIAYGCRPVAWFWMTGAVTGLKDSRIQAKFTARWVQQFFDLPDGIVTQVPVGEANYSTDDGQFRLMLPAFSDGEVQFWAADRSDGRILGRLVPDEPLRPAESSVRFSVCGTKESRAHDQFGFALRGQEGVDVACPPMLSH